ncbi:MAG: hypothetical protein GF353_25850 [Candidatus Lokiarchaeota archaeon]|nr:hypothetical protein [Candidatus Lokiarchaeota archaeon]
MNDSPIWRIKYLPKNLEQICGRNHIKHRLIEIIKNQNFPHLLFVGAEGIGKTTIADLFAKQFLGKYYDANYKVTYANVPLTSEERKQARSDAYISTSKIGSTAGKRITTPAFIQVKIKPFVQLKVLGGAPFKILVVKNFDALGSDQQGFRRLMEIYGQNCRMILITTKISGIIDPIISRCQLFLIPQADFTSFRKLIKKISDNESIELGKDVIEILYKISEGKIAEAIDYLQLSSLSSSNINLDSLYANYQKFQNDLIRSLLLMALRGDFNKARDIARNIVNNYKYDTKDLFSLLMKEIGKLPLSRYARIKLINLIADADLRSIDSSDSDIQISALISKICVLAEGL